jgi:hypothetical protein
MYVCWRGWCAPTRGVGYSVCSSLVDHILYPLPAARLPLGGRVAILRLHTTFRSLTSQM